MGIEIDMLLVNEAPENSVTGPQITAMPGITGGGLYELTDTSRFPATVETIYFSRHNYFQSVYTVWGQSNQSLQIPMPTTEVHRARIYVSASNPVESFGATYAGAALDGESTRTYAMVDLERPSQDGIGITLTPGDSGAASVYLFLEYDIELSLSADNEIFFVDGEKEYSQITRVSASVVDAGTKQAITASDSDTMSVAVTITAPGGKVIDQHIQDDTGAYILEPVDQGDFGIYQISVRLKVGEYSFATVSDTFAVNDVRPEVDPINWPLIVAIIAGLLIIAAALTYFLRQKRKQAVYKGAYKMESDYRFHGKLHICCIIADGGARDIPAFNFFLNRLVKEKRITLDEIFHSSNQHHNFPGADDILFLVGPDNGVVVRNNSQAKIVMAGATFGHREKLTMHYNNKVYIIFEEGKQEVEIYYRPAKEEGGMVSRAQTIQFTGA